MLLLASLAYFFWSERLVRVQVTKPIRGPALRAVYATGTVEPELMIPIAPRYSARLVELRVDEGDQVKRGDLLAKLESEDLESAIVSLRSKESFAKSEYDRQKKLFDKGAGMRQSLQAAQSEWRAAQAATEKAETEATYMSLVSPVDAQVIRRDGEVGEFIPSNQPIFWISGSMPLRISAEIDEEDISLIKVGQVVLISADAFPGEVFKGMVKRITPKGDPIARSYRVRIELNQNTPLKIGMTAETNIIISENKDALLIPNISISESQVWLVKDSKLTKQKVVIGAKGEVNSEIVTGLSQDDLVVIDIEQNYSEGMRVGTVFTDQR